MITAYGKQSYASAILGMLDSPELSKGLVPGVVGSTGNVAFGDLLEYDGSTQTDAYKLFDGTGVVAGVCVYEDTKQNGVYAPGDAFTVLRNGRIWVASYSGIAVAAAHPACAASLVIRSGVNTAGTTLYLVEFNLPPGNSVS